MWGDRYRFGRSCEAHAQRAFFVPEFGLSELSTLLKTRAFDNPIHMTIVNPETEHSQLSREAFFEDPRYIPLSNSSSQNQTCKGWDESYLH